MRLVTQGIVQEPFPPLKPFNLRKGEEGRLCEAGVNWVSP